MRYRRLGTSDVQVSEISLGCWTLGGLNWVDGHANGWADVDEAEAIRAINAAIDHGVNHFDNADVYGNGRAERLLAKALGARSREVVIATKVGHFRGTAEHAYEALHIRHQCEQSLRNLKRERVDIFYFHHGDFGPDDRYLAEAVAMVERLRDEGKIRLIGLSAYAEEHFLRLAPIVKPTVLQSWAHALDDQFIRAGSPVRRLMEARGMSFVAFSPLAQGRLLGKYDAKTPPSFEPGDHRRGSGAFSGEELAKLAPRIERLKSRFGPGIPDLARVALQYLLHEPVVACAIPGFRNLRQVEASLAADGRPLSAEDVAFVREALRD
ncbi:MAG: aldo/keto reductase [Planctomycetes bacterium]|nr:aldo/keto reductase [Planctomycetota bacterium]